MAQLNIAGYKAQKDSTYADNTNEDIAPIDFRTTFEDTADSLAFLNDVASITGAWTFSVVVKGITPVADEDLATKKYVDDQVGGSSGDVVGPASSTLNEIPTFADTTGKLIQAGTGVFISQTGDFTGTGNIEFATGTRTIAGIENQNLLDKTSNETIASGAIWTFTDSPVVPTPTTDFQAATKKYVDDNAGAGDVTAGTQANNQLAVWTSTSKEIEGDANLTWDGSQFSVGGTLSINDLTVDNIILDGNEISTSSGDLDFSPTGATNALTLAASTGNATFSSEIKTTRLSESAIRIERSGSDVYYMGMTAGGANEFRIRNSTQGFYPLIFESSGDATFSSDITADDFIFSGGGSAVPQTKTTGFVPNWAGTGTITVNSQDVTYVITGDLVSMQGEIDFGASTSGSSVIIDNLPEDIDGSSGMQVGVWTGNASSKFGVIRVQSSNTNDVILLDDDGLGIDYTTIANETVKIKIDYYK